MRKLQIKLFVYFFNKAKRAGKIGGKFKIEYYFNEIFNLIWKVAKQSSFQTVYYARNHNYKCVV